MHKTFRFLLPFVFACGVAAQAQTSRWIFKTESIAVNDADSVYFAFRSSSFMERDVSPDSVAINPPDESLNDDASVISIRKVSGGVADSVIAYAKGLDIAGRIVQNDSTMLFGASYAAPSSGNTFGNGNVHVASLSGLHGKYPGILVIVKMFDKVGGTRAFEIGHGRP